MSLRDRTRLLQRNVQLRDARLFVVATEGAETEPRYFEALQTHGLVPRSRIKLHLLPSTDGRSAPQHLIERVETFLSQYRLLSDDAVWLVLDTDLKSGNRCAQLSELTTLCRQKGWQVAISHPCFELWLLLHVCDAPAGLSDCASVQSALRNELGAYQKATTPALCCEPSALEDAVKRARSLDPASAEWPASLGTGVYRLLEALRASMP